MIGSVYPITLEDMSATEDITATAQTRMDQALPDFIRRGTKYESVNYGISNY